MLLLSAHLPFLGIYFDGQDILSMMFSIIIFDIYFIIYYYYIIIIILLFIL